MGKDKIKTYLILFWLQTSALLIGGLVVVVWLAVGNRNQNFLFILAAWITMLGIFLPLLVAERMTRLLEDNRRQIYEQAIEKLKADDSKGYQEFIKYKPIIDTLLEPLNYQPNAYDNLLDLILSRKNKPGRPPGPSGEISYQSKDGKTTIKLTLQEALPGLVELQAAKERGELRQAAEANPWGGGAIGYTTANYWLKIYLKPIAEYRELQRNSKE